MLEYGETLHHANRYSFKIVRGAQNTSKKISSDIEIPYIEITQVMCGNTIMIASWSLQTKGRQVVW